MLAEAAAFAAGQIPDPNPDIVHRLLTLVKPKSLFGLRVSEKIRLAALWSLGEINPPEKNGLLPKLTRDKNPRIASQARNLMDEHSY